MWITSSLTAVLTPTAVALGNFDGVHLGHRQVIQPVLPPQLKSTNEKLCSTVVTFHPHPQEFFSGQPRCLLTPVDEKAAQLSALGVQQLVLLPFDRELASLSPEQFVEQVLLQRLQARRISVGSDFHFGRGRTGTAVDLQEIASLHDVEVTIAPLKSLAGERISSSAIRQALQAGDLPLSNQLLGRPYSLVGKVFQGQQLGRKLGFPTANLKLPPQKFLPRLGVYAVRVHICQEGDILSLIAPTLPGVMNIGYRPTVDGTRQVVEVYLLDWSGDLYGQTLVVSLEKFLRPEQKFASLEELKAQIQVDCEAAKAVLGSAEGINNG
ncbi:bifunctional riboflavin kinase/FAD synthetase [Leptothermofonsia sp. ETS-13]|uniref:bifunctional riboflavin kinase/FAD synthetase n=1 Tax=Leptothermofonsia sp. ETS-13 TaxID=3035696 RepID=UPI003BA202D2